MTNYTYDFGFPYACEYLQENEIDMMDYDDFEMINRMVWNEEDE